MDSRCFTLQFNFQYMSFISYIAEKLHSCDLKLDPLKLNNPHKFHKCLFKELDAMLHCIALRTWNFRKAV